MKEQLSQKTNAMELNINQLTERMESMHNEKQLLSNQLKSLHDKIAELVNENLQQKEKISWMTVTNESNGMIKNKMDEMGAEKKQLAYEKGILQTHLKKLKEEFSQLQESVVSKLYPNIIKDIFFSLTFLIFSLKCASNFSIWRLH